MVPILGVAAMLAAIGIITACVGPLHYCKRSDDCPDTEEGTVNEEGSPPTIHVKITRPSHTSSMETDDTKEARETVEETPTPGPSEFPVRPPRAKRVNRQPEPVVSDRRLMPEMFQPRHSDRSSSSIWSTAMRERLQCMTNSSFEGSNGPRFVQATVEVYPKCCVSTSVENPELSRGESRRQDGSGSSKSLSSGTLVEDEKVRRISGLVVRKWKILKKSLIRPRASKEVMLEEEEHDETEWLSIPVPRFAGLGPAGNSTIQRSQRMIDASTSTKISQNISGLGRATISPVIRRGIGNSKRV